MSEIAYTLAFRYWLAAIIRYCHWYFQRHSHITPLISHLRHYFIFGIDFRCTEIISPFMQRAPSLFSGRQRLRQRHYAAAAAEPGFRADD
jgi:hypothetical protein